MTRVRRRKLPLPQVRHRRNRRGIAELRQGACVAEETEKRQR